MSLTEYHTKTVVFSFGEQQHTYFGSINNLAYSGNPEIIDSGRPFTFILGGFHPFSDTSSSFIKFCRRIHPNLRDHHILLDQDSFPLQATDAKTPAKVQARLEELPFHDGSIDYLFLDCTLNFMDQEQIRKFSADISRILKPEGLVLAMMKDPFLRPLGKFWGGIKNHVPIHIYSLRHLQEITSPSLKLVLEAINDTGSLKNFCLRTFARGDSKIPEHRGQPYVYDRGFIYPDKIGTGPVIPNLKTYLNPGCLKLDVEPISAFNLQPVGFPPRRQLKSSGS